MGKTYNLEPERQFTPLPTGEYQLTLKAWEEKVETETTKYSKAGDLKIQFTWSVAVPGGEDTERRVSPKMPVAYNKKSTVCLIGVALGMINPATVAADGVQLDFDRWINRSCLGTILKHPKESDPTSITDSIDSYALLAQQQAAAAPAGGNAIQARYNALMRFAGEEENTETVVTPGGWATAMKAVGARPMTDHARMELNGIVELLSDMGGADLSAKAEEVTTISEGFVMFGTIEAEVEAMG